MVVSFQATLGQPYEFSSLKDGTRDAPSLTFANTQTTGFYLEHGTSVGTTHDLVLGSGKGRVVAEHTSLGLQANGGLDGLRIRHHPSGRVWRSHTVINGSYNAILWIDELETFVTTNWDTGHVVTSKDGETWTASNAGVPARGLAWSPSLRRLVGVTEDRVWTSPDAVTWTEHTAPTGIWVSVTWAPSANAFVAIEAFQNPAKTMTSPDGITWTLGPTISAQLWRVSANATTIVVVGSSRIFTSTDGATWTQRHTSGFRYRGVTYSTDRGVYGRRIRGDQGDVSREW